MEDNEVGINGERRGNVGRWRVRRREVVRVVFRKVIERELINESLEVLEVIGGWFRGDLE